MKGRKGHKRKRKKESFKLVGWHGHMLKWLTCINVKPYGMWHIKDTIFLSDAS